MTAVTPSSVRLVSAMFVDNTSLGRGPCTHCAILLRRQAKSPCSVARIVAKSLHELRTATSRCAGYSAAPGKNTKYVAAGLAHQQLACGGLHLVFESANRRDARGAPAESGKVRPGTRTMGASRKVARRSAWSVALVTSDTAQIGPRGASGGAEARPGRGPCAGSARGTHRAPHSSRAIEARVVHQAARQQRFRKELTTLVCSLTTRSKRTT